MTETHAVRVAELPQNATVTFDISPDAEARALIAAELELSALRKLRFAGKITAQGRRDWLLEGTLGATVVQPCVVTLEPVTTRIDTAVRRLYLAKMEVPEGAEVEMPEDDTAEPLGAVIDPEAVMIEALELALPLYPRSEGAELGEAVFTEPGKQAMRDEDTRPFAALASLRGTTKDKP